jgi:hypothetical protein
VRRSIGKRPTHGPLPFSCILLIYKSFKFYTEIAEFAATPQNRANAQNAGARFGPK